MTVTININGLSLIHRASRGVSAATLPDVCLTKEGAPVPFENVAFSRDLAAGTRSVRVDGGNPAANARAVFAHSTGDDPGARGGVASGVHKAEASFLTHSPNVRLEGRPACRLTDKMLHNHGNTLNASGETQPPVKKARGKGAQDKDKVEKLLVEIRDAVTKKIVHAPVAVRLVAGKTKRLSSSRNRKGQVVFQLVKKRTYEIIAIHPCYPEAYGKVKVTKNKQKAVVYVQREKLRDVANAKGTRVGVRLNVKVTDWSKPMDRTNCGPPDQWDIAKEEFNDVVIATFWSSEQGDPNKVPDFGRANAVKAVAGQEGLGVEGTPLFWAAPGMSAPDSKDWRPNPAWIEKLPEYGNPDPEVRRRAALDRVKAFMQEALTKVQGVSRWVVINEPMNVICRANSGSSAFLKAIMPSAPDRTIKLSRKEKRELAETNRKRKKKGLTPRKPPTFLELTGKAIESLVEMVEHAHALAPNSLLIVGDYGIEGWDGKSGTLGMRGHHYYRMISRMKKLLLARGKASAVAKLRVGFQAHLRSGGQLGSLAAKEPLDFRPSSIRKQVRRFKKLGIPCVVTECDLELPSVKHKKRYKSLAFEHAALGKTNPAAYFANRARRKVYEGAFRTQRDLARDAIASLLDAGNLESLVWWSPDDDLAEAHGGTNFRYHGYLLHRYVGCSKCGAAMKVQGRYKKPKYWGTVAAFKAPRKASQS